MKVNRRAAALFVGVVGVCGLAAAQGMKAIYINGQKTSVPVRMINGTAYVPLAAIAKAYGDDVTTRPDGYSLAPAGGANQLAGKEGKIGEEIFNGQYKFQVKEMRTAATYETRYEKTARTIDCGSNEMFVILNCRIKNGTKQTQRLVLSNNTSYGIRNLALTDTDDHSFRPINWHGNSFGGFDARMDTGAPDGADVLPGAAMDFVLVFNVPKETVPKGLVFGILNYKDYSDKTDKAQYVRVRLTP